MICSTLSRKYESKSHEVLFARITSNYGKNPKKRIGDSNVSLKNAIISLSVLAILTICMFNSVAAAPVSKQTPDVHSSYAMSASDKEQPVIAILLSNP